ncbi:MAG: hypothetical protein Q8R79_00360 [Legionellaceae bacterium]|nr:hypothetical protein [Legionellaceae bacterium]
MTNLILHASDVGQWYTLVHEAQSLSNHCLPENTESYLVFLLMRSSHNPTWTEGVIGVEFLDALHSVGRALQVARLKEVGDKSLLFCGLFPVKAEKKVSLRYFQEIGKTAYLAASRRDEESQSDLLSDLGQNFLILQDILQATRHVRALPKINDMWVSDNSPHQSS